MIKRFVLKSVIFFIPLLLGLGCLELLVRRIPNEYSFKWKTIDMRCSDIETLVLGNSQLFYGVDTDVLGPTAFNMANVSQTLKYDDYVVTCFGAHLTRLRQVILPLSYFSLVSSLESGDEAWRGKNYRIYWKHPDGWPIQRNMEILNGTALVIKRIYGFYLRGNTGITCSATGFGLTYRCDRRPANWESTGAAAARRHTVRVHDTKILRENVSHVKSIIEKCRAKGVHVTLVLPPAWETYAEKLDPSQLQAAIITGEELAREPGVTYVNLLQDPRFTADDFYDADHLNEVGARKLARLLTEDVTGRHGKKLD